jgi:tRNA (mo5U34)-methyltransferase
MVEHISPLEDKVVCDLGCANGYFMFRMLEQKPKLVIGMDPNVKAWIEFHTLQLFAAQRNLTLEILTTDHVDMFPNTFDTMFCLGVVYHCADPIAALRKIHASLKPGGELILDCQCIPEEAIYPYTHRDDGTDGGGSGGGGEDSERSKEKLPLALFPRKTYANAKGIWFLPSKGCLLNWLARTQFHHVQVFYDEPLSVDEQRSTEWAPVNSLNESLDPKDPHKTVEGYPAPRRIYLKAKRK